MVVIVLTACPAKLRGHLTRWLLEVSPGVYVGHIPARVRDLLWLQVVELVKDGKAIMIHSTQGEQRLAFRTHRHEWEPVDFDGIMLMRRPSNNAVTRDRVRSGWSNASKMRRARRRK
ncbi:putative CRISPR-associated protein [Gordonia effusa NBRC 100432]|uniref:Putative CRISPR-associated protein n=1 Tax=Gordonia effusa NBRC 100432 TaxID=1077974 RepID=H0R5C2_9ACTN|nr:type I-E CRISPR-associated endoribonuclease Cas2e [Gordonia effusa]GAB20273.1 putative CRISPR-associated protein [Gordonia effusa NBRC 100432]